MQCPGEAGRLVWVLCTTALLRPVRDAAPDGGRGRSPDIPQLVTGHDRGMPMAYRGVVTMAIAALVAGGPDGGPKLGTSFEKELPCCVQSQFSKTARWQQRIALRICPVTPGCSGKLVAAWGRCGCWR